MRIVYVAGFFDPVKSALDGKFKEQQEDGSVVWIRQASNGAIDLKRLKELLLDAVANGADEILILAFVLHGWKYRYVHEAIEGMMNVATQRFPGLKISVVKLKNSRDGAEVVRHIEALAPQIEREWPVSLDGLEEWATQKLQGRVLLHPRALRSAKKSQFEDVKLIYEALALLAEEYWLMKTTKPAQSVVRRSRFEARLFSLGLELTPSISESRAGECGDDYFVEYPLGGENTKLLDLHLKKGSDWEERFCLRIYFFWDAENLRSVVGWLPGHL